MSARRSEARIDEGSVRMHEGSALEGGDVHARGSSFRCVVETRCDPEAQCADQRTIVQAVRLSVVVRSAHHTTSNSYSAARTTNAVWSDPAWSSRSYSLLCHGE